jgi:uncharacterized membrane protein YeiH
MPEEAVRTLVLVVDLAGTFVFALSGALAGVERRLDLFGVLVLSFAAGCFRWHRLVWRWRSPVLLFDGAGLAFFAVSGAQKAVAFGIGPAAAALLGMLTGIGGGMTRDVLLAQVPTVLRAELYAVAALAGAAVVVTGDVIHAPAGVATVMGIVLCFALRMMSIRRGWRLPTPPGPEEADPGKQIGDR